MNIFSFIQVLFVLHYLIQLSIQTSLKIFECPLPYEMICKISNFVQFEDIIINYKVYIQPISIQSCSTNEALIQLKRDGLDYFLDQNIENYTFNLCLKYKEDPLEHVGFIIYLGFIRPVSIPILAQGDHWNLEYLVSTPIGKNPNQLPMYSNIVLKSGSNCDGSLISQGKLVQKDYPQELPIISFTSGNTLISDMSIATFCTCSYISDCKLISHYTHPLATTSIKGPNSMHIIMDCVYGKKCEIQIPGNYEHITGNFNYSTHCKDNLQIINNQQPGLFIFPESGYTHTQITTQYLLCWQLIKPRLGISFSIGTIYTHYLYNGNIIVVPFGNQILFSKRFNPCLDGTLLLYEQISGGDWNLVSKLPDDDEITVDYNFSIDSKYELRYCNNCDEHIHCLDESRDSNALIYNLLLRGVISYTNVTCTIGSICKFTLPIINQTLGTKESTDTFGNVLLSHECGVLNQLKFIPNYGLIPVSHLVSNQGKLFAEYTISGKKIPNSAASNLLHICYCNTELSSCKLSDYIIQVGTLFFRDSTIQECWTGNSCIFSVNGTMPSEKISLRLACHIPASEVIFVDGERYARFIETFTLNSQIKSRFEVKLSGSMMNNSMLKICLDTGVVLGEISIKSLSVVPYKLYIDSYKLVKFKTTEFVSGNQVLLVNGVRHKSTLEFTDSNFTVSLDMPAGIYGLFWCFINKFTTCKNHHDFRLQIATIYLSGLTLSQKQLRCVSGLNCVASLNLIKYFPIGNSFTVDQITPFSIAGTLDKDCMKGALDSKFIFYQSSHSYGKPRIIAQSDVLSLSYIIDFIAKIPSYIMPNVYNVCLTRQSESSLLNGILITLEGIIYSKSPILIDSGRPFNLNIRGYNMSNTIYGFLSNKSHDCIKPQNITINMKLNPTLSYNVLGLIHYIWSGVYIKYNTRNFDGRLYLCLCWKGDCNNPLEYLNSGIEIAISGPKFQEFPRLLMGSDLSTISIDTLYPVTKSSILIRSTTSTLHTGLSSHEIENLLYLRIRTRKQIDIANDLDTHNFAKYNLTPTRVFDNAMLYYCAGYQCNSLEDFSTPIFEIIIGGPKHRLYMAEPDLLSFVTIPPTDTATVYDKFQIVYDDFDCKRAVFQNGTIVSNTMNYLKARDYRHLFQITLKDEFRYSSGVSSLGLVIYTSTMKRSYKICYCPFSAKLRCDRASDFSIDAGAIYPNNSPNNLPTITSQTNTSSNIEKLNLQIDRDYIITSQIGESNALPIGIFYVSNTAGDLPQFLTTIRNIHRAYGLRYKLSFYDSIGESRDFIIDRPGVYSNQQFVLKASSPNLLIIRGRDLDKYKFDFMGLVLSNCDSATPEFPIYYKTSSLLEYHNVVIQHIGYYRVCIQSDGKWLDVGVASVKNFNRIPSFNKNQFTCLGYNGVYVYDGRLHYYKMGQFSYSSNIDVMDKYIVCTVSRNYDKELLLLLDAQNVTLIELIDGSIISTFKFPHTIKSPNHIQAVEKLVFISGEEGLFYGDITSFTLQKLSEKPTKSFSIVSISPFIYIFAIQDTLQSYRMDGTELSLLGSYYSLSLPRIVHSIVVSGSILTFVGERSTGRLVALEGYGDLIRLYKEIDTVGILNGVDSLSGYLSITSTLETINGLENVTNVMELESLTRIEFDYPIPEILQSGEAYHFNPIITGDLIDFITLEANSYGLKIDPDTFTLSGILIASGNNTLKLKGGNLFGFVFKNFTFTATCSSGFGWSEHLGICIECPIGTFRGGELISACNECQSLKANSTTLYIGSTSPHDCVCGPGFYQSSDDQSKCSPCDEGKFKTEAGDATCIQTCPKNMSSIIRGAKTMEELDCKCIPGFYPITADKCQSCDIGFYCTGGSAQPAKCPVNTTTISQGAPNIEFCQCSPGYENDYSREVFSREGFSREVFSREVFSRNNNNIFKNNTSCIECKKSHYKSHVGNNACTPCSPTSNDQSWFNMLLFSDKVSSIDVSECRYCASGYYFESGSCCICPISSYCPGLTSPAIFCGQNAMAQGFRAADPINCRCQKGFSHLVRSPLDNSIVCKPCSSNWNYPIDISHIPLYNEVYKSTGSKWINSEGFYLPKLKLWNSSPESPQIKCTNTFDGEFWGWYETQIYSQNAQTCAKTCGEFQFCRGFLFATNDAKHYYVLHSSQGALKIPLFKCKLFIYSFIGFNNVKPTHLMDGVIPTICQLSAEDTFPLPCPSGHYCPEDSEPIRCPPNATTLLPNYSKSINDCLCNPGYQSVKDMECVPCPFGYYKSTIGNDPCIKCMEFLTSVETGSKSPFNCACLPGYFASKYDYTFKCLECLDGNYCEGGFSEGAHSMAKNCPIGSEILPSVRLATSLKQCVCLPGYEYNKNECIKCIPGSYKEYHDNSSCSGRCPQSAMSFFGAISKSQCFCQYGFYMNKGYGSSYGAFTGECTKCPFGALCPGGLRRWFVDKLRQDGSFTDIIFSAHVQPLALPGYWTDYDNGSFHPCANIDACIGGLDRCVKGSGGYLCDECLTGYIYQSFRGCVRWHSWLHQITIALSASMLRIIIAFSISRYSFGGMTRVLYYSTLALIFTSRSLKGLGFLWNAVSYSHQWPFGETFSTLSTLAMPLIEYAISYPILRNNVIFMLNIPGLALAIGQMIPCTKSPLYDKRVHIHRPSIDCGIKTQLIHSFILLLIFIIYYFIARDGFFLEGSSKRLWQGLATLRIVALVLATVFRNKIHSFQPSQPLWASSAKSYYGIELIWMILYFYINPHSPDCDAVELAGIFGNIITASVLQASMYYDISYIEFLPLFAFGIKIITLIRRVFATKKFASVAVESPPGHDFICSKIYSKYEFVNHSLHYQNDDHRGNEKDIIEKSIIEKRFIEKNLNTNQHDDDTILFNSGIRVLEDVDGRIHLHHLPLYIGLEGDELILQIISMLKNTDGSKSIRSSDDVLDLIL